MARTKQPKVEPCVWTEDFDDGSWNGDCGAKWCLTTDDGPKAHGMKFCPACGKPLKEVR